MSKAVTQVRNDLRTLLIDAVGRCIADGVFPENPIPDFSIEAPADKTHGDFAANIAMVSARAFRLAPRKIAEEICARLDLSDICIDKWEIAGPGFINFFAGSGLFAQVVREIEADGEAYGRSDYGKGERVLVEFISANPTGPMHMGNARGGALGDGLAAVLDAAGYYVEREFYVNDAGNQIDKFALSLDIRYRQIFEGEDNVPLPEDSYHGADIMELAKEFCEIHGDSYLSKSEEERRKALVEYALPKNIKRMQEDTKKYRIEYDTWFFESVLHKNGDVNEVIDILSKNGLTYEKDGAIWYEATRFGGEKDEVLIRANGNPTYFAADIAYHRNKFAVRGFDRCINIWGADHHGHVARLKGAMDAVGLDGSKLDVVLMQLVKLLNHGEPVRMSKRTGKAIQLADLLDEVPIDSARFFFNMREASSQMDFDLGLAVEQNSQNPVYYVQYAHARICSIIKALAAEGITLSPVTDEQLSLLTASEEIELMRKLSDLPDEIILAAKNYDPARITHYVTDLATLFHKFYNACRVKGTDANLTNARLALCTSTATVVRSILNMFKITAPVSM